MYPREAGTEDAVRARAALQGYLECLGYQIEVQRFRFSPSALRAFPLLGAGLGWLSLLQLPLLLLPAVPRWAPLAVWLPGMAALGIVVWGIAVGWAPLGADTREDANLVATKPGEPVRRWLVAHADSKAQGHSMAGRLAAIWMVIAAVAVLTLFALLRLRGTLPAAAAGAGALLALAAGCLAGRGRLVGSSRGARDNGTGLLAVLTAAEAGLDASVGVLITGAEEFGLVGSRIFARVRGEELRGAQVVNFDTIDEQGFLYLVSHDAAGGGLARTEAARLASLGLPIRHRRLPLGIFVDSHPLARAGASAITVGRLTWQTLRTIHTDRDTLAGITLETADRVGRAIARSD